MGVIRTASGVFETAGDSDWFRVKLTAGTTYEFKGTAFGGQFLTFQVLLPNGQPVAQPISFSNYANFVAPVTGDYFVAATSSGALPMGGGSYNLTVEDVVDPIPASPATPRTLAVGGTETVTGNNNAVTQNDDWFAISVTAGQSYVLNTNLITGRVYFADANGQVLAIEGFQGSGGQQAHFTATTTGTLYAGASHGGGPQYNLSLTAVADDRGTTAATAGALTIGTPATGRWEAAGDDDAYLVSLTAGQSYNFAVQNLDSATIPPFIRILDIAGNLLWTSQSQSSPSSTVFAPATTGNYLVSVGIGAVGSSDPTPLRYLDGWNHSLTGAVVAGDLTDNPTTTGVVTVGGGERL